MRVDFAIRVSAMRRRRFAVLLDTRRRVGLQLVGTVVPSWLGPPGAASFAIRVLFLFACRDLYNMKIEEGMPDSSYHLE